MSYDPEEGDDEEERECGVCSKKCLSDELISGYCEECNEEAGPQCEMCGCDGISDPTNVVSRVEDGRFLCPLCWLEGTRESLSDI